MAYTIRNEWQESEVKQGQKMATTSGIAEREYTVTEVARMTGVTVKTLHHYHKKGLLTPHKVTEAGYRLAEGEIDAAAMNDAATHAMQFTNDMIAALRAGWRPDDARVQKLLAAHIAYLAHTQAGMDAQAFAAQTRFFINDDSHRAMLENQQVGLAYYLFTAATLYAETA